MSDRFDGQLWEPSTYTKPLRPGPMLTDGPRLVRLIEQHWRAPSVVDQDHPTGGGLIRPHLWQRALASHVLERFPLDWPEVELRGRLRYRQCIVSLGRQNGKSLLGGMFGLYGLIQHVPGPRVLGVATSREKANIVYDRVRYAVDHDEALHRILKATGTRGIGHRDKSGSYVVQPSKAEGVQGEPASAVVADELHLMPAVMWDSVVKGQTSMAEALALGITTAGDESSALLKRLYERGLAAVADPDSDPRFGFFLWEAPEGASLEVDAHCYAANPSLAEGHIDLAQFRSDARDQPRTDLDRYTFNRFVKSVSGAWLDMDLWRRGHRDEAPEIPPTGVVFAAARTDGWQFATITAHYRLPDGGRWAEVVASLRRPTWQTLAEVLAHLLDEHPGAVAAVDSVNLSQVGKHLRELGREVYILTPNELGQAAAHVYALVARGEIRHPSDELLTRQLPTTKRSNVHGTGGWRIVPGAGDADAALATVAGLWALEIRPEPSVPIW